MQLTTERLILREFKTEDWAAVFAYQSQPLYLCYYAWTERTPAAVQEFVKWFTDQQLEEPRIKRQLVVTLKSTGQLIGNCGIRLKSVDATEADIGFELAPEHWGQGYATEAAQAIVNFGFNELKVHRIWSWCIADNTGSAHVLEKVGLRPEGRLRDHEYFKGRWWDTLMFAMLEDEWRAKYK